MHNQPNYGSLHFDDPRDFAKPLTSDEQIQQALAVLAEEPLHPPRISDWLPLVDCVPRGTGFSLEANTPAIRAFLRFDPSGSPLGDYEIHPLQKPPNEIGRVLKITSVSDEDLSMLRFAVLKDFPTRYLVKTSDSRGKTRLWFVGIKSTRKIEPDSN